MNYPALNSAVTTPGLPTGQIVGIVQFKWCAGRNIPAGLTNMTAQLARDLYGSGKAALALWTGLSTDHGTKIYAVGRDFDSGTRLTTFAETGVGAKAVVKQYFPEDGSGNVSTPRAGRLLNSHSPRLGASTAFPTAPAMAVIPAVAISRRV